MTGMIEDYALLGNCETVALVDRGGSIDWLGLPRFDSPACFAALLGSPDNGRWLVAPADAAARVTRCYRGDTLILQTTFETDTGAVCVIDFMTRRAGATDIVRLVRGVSGTVAMRMELVVRFDYGSVVPWVRRIDGVVRAIAGPEALDLSTPVETHGRDLTTVADFVVHTGERIPFVLTWHLSFEACTMRYRMASWEP